MRGVGGEGEMKLSRSIGWAEKESFLKGVVEGKGPCHLQVPHPNIWEALTYMAV